MQRFIYSFTAFVMLLSLNPLYGQKSFLRGAIGIMEVAGNKVPAKFGPGTELSYLLRVQKGFYMGLSMDYYTCDEQGEAIHVPYNLASGERVYNNLNIFGGGLITYFDLSPNAKTKFYTGGRLALRSVTSKTIHDGDALIFFAMEETLYEKRTVGPAAELFLSLYIPFSKKEVSPIGMELKCAYVAGGSVSYINSKGVYYNSSKDEIVIPSPQKSALNTMTCSLGLIWNFN